ncbi:MBL fold metallo-hydrolase [Nocardioides sp. PD653-B2]|uniref:MBL fold metallo-hydrolase n=1 Tax=Nocardioides sp. PD653-B2 TaxID=1892811 RepID=UPI0009EFEA9C|nr:Putative hydrolase [Nocardioides sp. PD653-B2]GAW53746.1 putative hydrolase [Nocardioides sp. PD653]
MVGDRFYIIDAGHGVGHQIRKARLGNWEDFAAGPLDALQGVFLTHLHSDHTVDLANILIAGIASNGLGKVAQPVQVWGPGPRGELPTLFGPAPAPPVTSPENPTPGTADMIQQFGQHLRHRHQRPGLRHPDADPYQPVHRVTTCRCRPA